MFRVRAAASGLGNAAGQQCQLRQRSAGPVTFEALHQASTHLLLQQAALVVLLGGNVSSVNALLAHYLDLAAPKLLHVGTEAFLTAYDRLYRCVAARAR